MKATFHVWRQAAPGAPGSLERYPLDGIEPSLSLLEALDLLNEALIERGERPIEFEHDCREGICGSCSMVVDGRPHGPGDGSTTCQLYMRQFEDGADIVLEPYRVRAFPVLVDLSTDRSAFDRIIQAGGYVTVNTGNPPDGNAMPIPKDDAERAMDAAACIGCGACAAACKNGSAMLFVGAKVEHLARVPQGKPEADGRVLAMVDAMDAAGFGSCTNQRECEAVCPKLIPYDVIPALNRRWLKARVLGGRRSKGGGGGVG